MKLKSSQIIFDFKAQSRQDVFEWIADQSFANNLILSKQDLIDSFENRETEITTAMTNEFSIPHARFSGVIKPAVFFIRLSTPIIWDSDKNKVKNIVALLVPEEQGDYLDILSGIAIKLLNEEMVKKLQTSTDKAEICELINKEEHQKENVITSKDALTIVGITSCPSGVAHTYMARDSLLEGGKKLNWNVFIETQGSKGQDFVLTNEQISQADAVIIAADLTVELDRFVGKKVYHTGTKDVIDKPAIELQRAISKGKELTTKNVEMGAFDIGNKKGIVKHLMAGISYMIPFIVFAGLISAIVSGIWANVAPIDETTHQAIDIMSPWDSDITKNLIMGNSGLLFLKTLRTFADIGFMVMMGVAGGYIANSIAGRAAIAPAFILTMMGNNTKLVWQGYFQNMNVHNPFWGMAGNTNPETIPLNDLMQNLNIIGAIIFGLIVGYTVKFINTKVKVNKYLQPIMPIIIIPVFVTGIIGIIWMFTFGPLVGLAVGYLNFGIMKMEQVNSNGTNVGMLVVGLVLGLMAGVDMGGPINKLAFYGATALMPIDKGLSMGAVAGTSAIAPLGCGMTSLIFRKKFKDDKPMGISASILGFMGISESAIPFAAKYGWPVFVANILASGVTGAIAGSFMIQGHVGAWGGVIIAVFAGVTDNSGNFIGELWYIIAIAAGIVVHILLFRTLMGIKDHEKLNTMFKKEKVVLDAKH